MIRNTLLGVIAAAILVAAAGGFVTATFAPTSASASHYSAVSGNKLSYLNGRIQKCLENQGECGLTVH